MAEQHSKHNNLHGMEQKKVACFHQMTGSKMWIFLIVSVPLYTCNGSIFHMNSNTRVVNSLSLERLMFWYYIVKPFGIKTFCCWHKKMICNQMDNIFCRYPLIMVFLELSHFKKALDDEFSGICIFAMRSLSWPNPS